jgi:mannosyltransferase OCH1-like enzyme
MAIQIHQVLFDGRAPLVNRRCLSSWGALRPHFEIRAWENDDLRTFVGRAHPLVKRTLTSARNFGEASDILRIAIVHEFGGLYTDWDIYLLNPQQFAERFAAFSENGVIFLRDSRTSDPDFAAIVTHSFFYSQPRRSLLHSFLERIGDNYKNSPNQVTVHMTGPHAFTRFLLDAGWNLDAPQFVEQDQFFRHRFDIAAAQTDKSQFLDEAMKDPGTAPLLNLWTNSWVEPAVKTTLKKLPVVGAWVSDPFSASLKYILSE